jgi:hypothetical protein
MYVGFEVLAAVVAKSPVFWNITPCSALEVSPRFRGTFRLHLQNRRIRQAVNQRERWQAVLLLLVSCLAYSSTINTEATCSSETSGDFGRSTRRYIPDDRTLQFSDVVLEFHADCLVLSPMTPLNYTKCPRKALSP